MTLEGLSPMMQQWHACKQQAKDALLLFRMGDFYEAFYHDASTLAKELELTLTQRQNIPMAGVPFHSSETYIDRLVAKGYRVAIAEQMEDPKLCKGLVRREVVRTVSPGSLIQSSLLQEKSNNYLASFTQVGALFGAAFLDITTAEFLAMECESLDELWSEVARLQPKEILTSEKFHNKHPAFFSNLASTYQPMVSQIEDWRFDHHTAGTLLLQHFAVHNLDGFGLKGKVSAINAAGALLSYLKQDLGMSISHLRHLQTYSSCDFLLIDPATQVHLELVKPLHEGSRHSTLLFVLDHTVTPMGGRLLRQWILRPLLTQGGILERQEAIAAFLAAPKVMNTLPEALEQVRDLERLCMRIETGYALPRDLVALRSSLLALPAIKREVALLAAPLLARQQASLTDLSSLTDLLTKALEDAPPLRTNEGNIFKAGYHEELDRLKEASRNGKAWIATYQNQLRDETGIKTLKVSYTKAFGYYIEVSKGQCDKMPSTFHRKQTLTNCERFISPELKEYEDLVLHAQDHACALEEALFKDLCTHLATYQQIICDIAKAIAHIDALQSLSIAAKRHHYVAPQLVEDDILEIIEGRHPVVEAAKAATTFVPNDTYLDSRESRLLVLTGPNMAGKSTYIRQVALILIMAQMGSFVPAKAVRFGLFDKVFSRIGASDDLSRGQSTFMVEMTETANILHHATSRSLVILDEIGRGTSTYDGISIAWSVAEHLLKAKGKQAKTLFATHYWELTALEGKIPGAVNYNVGVKECDDKIIFLHKILKGGADKSYGIHVAQLAGMPKEVLERAKEILRELEDNTTAKGKVKKVINQERTLFDAPQSPPTKAERVLEKLQSLALDETTPKEALEKLFHLQQLAQHL